MTKEERPPAGWYPDPLHNKRERYWDGKQWEQDEHGSGLVPAGYITAVVLPIVGLVIGIVAGTREDARTRRHGPYIVVASIVCGVLWALTLSGSAHAGTRAEALKRYADHYAVDQGWALVESPTFVQGDFRRSYFTSRFLANPAPRADACFGDVVSTDMPGCPDKWYEDDGPFWMDVEMRIARCGPGWFVVSTPLDRNPCPTRFPAWNDWVYQRPIE